MSDDHFNDIDLERQAGFGVFAGMGAEDQFSTSHAIVPTGVRNEVKCTTCGTRQHCFISWDELIFVSQGVPPPGAGQSPPWAYVQRYGAMHPNTPCCSCGRQDALLLLTPDEASRHLKAGQQAGLVAPEYVARGAQQVKQLAGQYRR